MDLKSESVYNLMNVILSRNFFCRRIFIRFVSRYYSIIYLRFGSYGNRKNFELTFPVLSPWWYNSKGEKKLYMWSDTDLSNDPEKKYRR